MDIPNKLIGSWELVEHSQFGRSATGLLIYHPDGSMAVVISGKADALIAYAGGYRLKGNVVTHIVEVAENPQRVGCDQRRRVSWKGDVLTLSAVEGSGKGFFARWRRRG